jgi:hypothetical protein
MSRLDDKVGPAIAAVEQAEQTVTMQQLPPITISSTGRPVLLSIPVDITDSEIAELCGWMLTGLMAAKRAERANTPASRILVPAGAGLRQI